MKGHGVAPAVAGLTNVSGGDGASHSQAIWKTHRPPSFSPFGRSVLLDRLSSLLGHTRRPERVFGAPADIRGPYDVAIVGGGVRALALARACAAEKSRVALFAPAEISAAPDERAWPVLRAAHADARRAAADSGADRLARKLSKGEAAIDRAGCLTVVASPQELELLAGAAAELKDVVECWMVPSREVSALSPPLAGARDVAPALYEPGASAIDADALALALAEAAASAGAELYAFAPAAALERDADGAATGIRLETGVVEATAIVLADDVSAIRLVREGKGRLSLVREERIMLVTAAGGPSIGPALAIGGLRITRDRAGAVTVYGPVGADALAREMTALAPALSGMQVVAEEPVTAWRGVDGLAQVGPAEIEGLWLALGFGLDALSLALPAAEALAAQLSGRRARKAFDPLAPTRKPASRPLETVR